MRTKSNAFIPRWIHLLALLLPLSLAFGSCSKYLDVTPENHILEDKLFETPEGVRIAVNGVYRSLSSNDLFGKNLTWGMLTAVSNTYRLSNDLPNELRMAANFEWESSAVSNLTEAIWKRAYNTLANCNLILQQVETLDYSKFNVDEFEKAVVLGEMHAARALIHFEIIRLFGPPPATGRPFSLPYVAGFPAHQAASLPVEQVYTRIVQDLEKAAELLAPVDTDKLAASYAQASTRLRNPRNLTVSRHGDFLHFRSQRLNYYAALALLSRVQFYRGKYQEAQTAAEQVYDAHMQSVFTWTPAANQGQVNNVDVISTKRPEELIFALSNNKNYDNWEASARGSTSMTMANLPLLFDDDLDDFRIVGWYNRHGDERYLTWIRPLGVSVNAMDVAAFQGPLIPMIGIAEIYHILIECAIRAGDLEQAQSLFETLRFNRGAKRALGDHQTAENLMEELVRDIHRESLTGGQTFYLYKRLLRPLFNGQTEIVMEAQQWQPELPHSETAY